MTSFECLSSAAAVDDVLRVVGVAAASQQQRVESGAHHSHGLLEPRHAGHPAASVAAETGSSACASRLLTLLVCVRFSSPGL